MGKHADVRRPFWMWKCLILMPIVIVPPLPELRIYRSHENMKKRSYQARICEVEHGTFTPLVFSATGRMSDEAYAFYKHLASLLSNM